MASVTFAALEKIVIQGTSLRSRFAYPDYRKVLWLGVLALLLSLLTPVMSLQAADAAQTRASQEADCNQGFILNERTGECEPIVIPAQIQDPTGCEDGMTRNRDTGECEPEVPDQIQQAPEDCPEVTTRDPAPGDCVPVVIEEPPVQQCPEGAVLNQVTATCDPPQQVDDPAVEPTEPPMLGEPPQVPEHNTFSLTKYRCPLGAPYDELGLDLQDVCTDPHDGISFTVSWEAGVFPKVTDANGDVAWTDIPAGPYSVEELITEGYGDPYVFCRDAADDKNGQSVWNSHEPLVNGVYLTEFEGTGNHRECLWFNIPDSGSESRVRIIKNNCQDGAPESEGGDIPFDDFEVACTQPGTDAEFTLDNADGSSTLTIGDGASPDSVLWEDVPLGPFTITETMPPGYVESVWFCGFSHFDDGSLVPGPLELVIAPDGVHSDSIDHPEGGIYFCWVFNIPGDDQGTGIVLYKRNCPEQFLMGGDPLDSYVNGCTEHGDGVEFTLDNADGSSPNSIAAGTLSWSDVPQGPFTITETIPPGYGGSIWYCAFNYFEDGVLVTADLEPVDAPGGVHSASIDHPEGGVYVCWVFNIPDGKASVTIHKWICPTGVEPATAEADCSEVAGGVTFTIDDGNPPSPDDTQVTGDDQGTVTFAGLEPGTHTVTEELPEGFSGAFGWCVGILMPAQDLGDPPQMVFELEEGEHRECHWYNVEEGDRTVVAYKAYCPEGVQAELEDFDDWIAACTDVFPAVDFDHTDSSGTTPNTTWNGAVGWQDVEPGENAITEHNPDGYQPPIVFCKLDAEFDDGAAYAEAPTQYEVVDNTVTKVLDYAEFEWVCYFFNIPEDDASSITVRKYNCPPTVVDIESQYEICTEPGDGIEFTLDTSDGPSTKAIAGGIASWDSVPEGPFTLTEDIPAGYGDPAWFCGEAVHEDGFPILGAMVWVDAPGGVLDASIDIPNTSYLCWVFNWPDDDRTVTVYKWRCLPGLEIESGDFEDWEDGCAHMNDGVDFTLTDGNGESTKTTTGGDATWYGTTEGQVSITEHTPPGYEDPVVFCTLEAYFEDGGAYAEALTLYEVDGSTVSRTLDYAEYEWICHFFNVQKGPGEITIHKWTCPPGYDIDAWDADPTFDCTEATDGIEFAFGLQDGPAASHTTGDVLPGAIHVDELEPGSYVVTELVPTGTDYVFVWDCVGGDIPAVHPMPLNVGNALNIDVAAGDSIVCHWYNVPEPETAKLTVEKYACWTATFASVVDCEIYEFGASFELFDAADTSLGVGVTDAGGTYTWDGLAEGAYSLDEVSHTPCHVTISNDDGDGNAVVVAGEETIVRVYNCEIDTGGKIPNKYPNTGAGPSTIDTTMSPQDEPAGTATPTAGLTNEEFYEVNCLDQPIVVDGTPAAAPATPAADDACARGAIPEHLTIDDASVDADIEVVEIVDGLMQPPSGPNVAAWYKETARLGETNNTIVAGHLNSWNVTEGVFYHLDDLDEGERIEVTGEDGLTYVYEVQWVRQESNLAPPALDVVGPTDEPSLTLITCGGEWNAEIVEYDERTVVRAVQIDVTTAEENPDNSNEAAMLLAA